MNLLITQNSQNVSHNHSEESAGSHSHTTDSLKNKAGTADITTTSGMSANSTGQATSGGTDEIGIINRANGATWGNMSKGDNCRYAPYANTGATGSKLKIDVSHVHNMEHSHTTNSAGSHTHTINASGGTETRTVNYSYKVWKRVS